jgi:hypothetical protein
MGKWSKKGREKRAENRNVHKAFFSALFGFHFFSSDFIQYGMLDLDFVWICTVFVCGN